MAEEQRQHDAYCEHCGRGLERTWHNDWIHAVSGNYTCSEVTAATPEDADTRARRLARRRERRQASADAGARP